MSRILKLRTPASRLHRSATAESRLKFAKSSEKYRSAADKEKDQWPWQFQYAGYLGIALAFPGTFFTAITEKPGFRGFLEGTVEGREGFSWGKKVVDWWRSYYTAVDGVVVGFHNEDWRGVVQRRGIAANMAEEGSVRMTVRGDNGEDKACVVGEEGGKVKDVMVGREIGKVSGVVFMDREGGQEEIGGDGVLTNEGQRGEDAFKNTSVGASTTTGNNWTLLALTQGNSSWTNYNSGSAAVQKPVEQESASDRQRKVSDMKRVEIDYKIECAEKMLREGTGDIDDLVAQVKRLKKERRKVVGWFS